MKARNLTLVAVGMILIAAVAVSYLMAKPSLFVQHKEGLVFIGEELIVHKAVSAITVKPAVKALKVSAVPAPAPKVATPLPIFPPTISYSVLPAYPTVALEKGLEGSVLLSVYVGLNGAAERVEVKSSSGAEFHKSALAAVSQWTFNPASQGGSAMASWFEVPVRFSIN